MYYVHICISSDVDVFGSFCSVNYLCTLSIIIHITIDWMKVLDPETAAISGSAGESRILILGRRGGRGRINIGNPGASGQVSPKLTVLTGNYDLEGRLTVHGRDGVPLGGRLRGSGRKSTKQSGRVRWHGVIGFRRLCGVGRSRLSRPCRGRVPSTVGISGHAGCQPAESSRGVRRSVKLVVLAAGAIADS